VAARGRNAFDLPGCFTTNRAEKRLFWFFIFCGGLALAALPLLLPSMRYPALDLSAGGLMMAAAAFRLWLLRRRIRRDPWNPES
jgi:hypothetical protein